MTGDEKSLLQQLDRILQLGNVREQIAPIISRVQAELAQKTSALMTWEPIPLEIFPDPLPTGIRSSWVLSCVPALTPVPNGIPTVISA